MAIVQAIRTNLASMSLGVLSGDLKPHSSSSARPWQREDLWDVPTTPTLGFHMLGLPVTPCGQPCAKLCSWGACSHTPWVGCPPDQSRRGQGQITRDNLGRFTSPGGERMATAIAAAVQSESHVPCGYARCSELCMHQLMLCVNSPWVKALLASQG